MSAYFKFSLVFFPNSENSYHITDKMASISIFTPFFHRATTFLNSFVFAVNLIHFFLWHLSSAQKYFWADEEGIFFTGSSKAEKTFYFNTNMRSCPSLNCVSLLYFGYLKNFLHFLWLPFLLKRFLLKIFQLHITEGIFVRST